MRGQYVQITKIRYLCFDLVHSRYTRVAGFGRREIELMQALCIYNIYIEYYSVGFTVKKNSKLLLKTQIMKVLLNFVLRKTLRNRNF